MASRSLLTVLVVGAALLAGTPRAHAQSPPADQAIEVIVGLLDDTDRGVRFAAAQALGRIGPRAASGVPRLAVMRNDREWCVRAAATRALGQIGSAGIPALRESLDERTTEEQVMVLRALAWVGAEAKPLIAARVEHPDERVAEAAAAALEVCGRRDELKLYRSVAPEVTTPPGEIPELVLDLQSPWLDRQFAAREALLRAGPAAAAPVAESMAGGRYDVLWHAEEIFRVLGPEGTAAVPHLAALLEHDDENIREVAARLLGEIGPGASDAASGLIRILADRRIAVRGKAMVALGRIGRDAAVPVLGAADDPDARRRAGLAFALGWMYAEVEPLPYDPRLPVAEPGPVAQTGYVPSAEHLTLASRVGQDVDYEVPDQGDRYRAEALAVLRAGLRLRDTRAAMVCAARLGPEEMDAWEAERAVELLLPECFKDDPPTSFGHIYEYLGSEEVAAAVGYFALSGRPSKDFILVGGACHRIVRPDILPCLDRVGATPDAWVFDAGGTGITMPRNWSDRFRAPAGDSPGLPSELRALLTEQSKLEPFTRRWLVDSRPGPQDAELLLELVERFQKVDDRRDRNYDLKAVLQSLGWLADEGTGAVLRGLAEKKFQALAALARRGDPAALSKLALDASWREDYLAMLLNVNPSLGREVLLGQLAGGDLEAPYLDLGLEILEWSYNGAAYRREALAGIDLEFLAMEPRTEVLAQAAWRGPGLRTRPVAEALFARLSKEGPRVLSADPDYPYREWPSVLEIFAFLDVVDRERLRRLLRTWVREREGTELESAVRLLACLGDAESAPELIRWIRAHPEKSRDARGSLYLARQLARSASPEVEDFLSWHVHEDPEYLAALLECRGVPGDLAGCFLWKGRSAPELLELIFADPADALISCLWNEDRQEYGLPEGLGLWEEPKILEFLKGLREKPHLVSVPRLTGQLAAAGDERARRELWSAVRVGRYRWICYENEYDGLTLGWDPQTYPFLLYDTEGNCCRGGHVARMFDSLMGKDHLDTKPHGIDGSPARNARRWIDLHGGRFVRSPFSHENEGFVPAVR